MIISHQSNTRARRRGFTLTELLVVIVVIVLLFTVAVPNISELLGAGRDEVARNAFSVAVGSARTWSGVASSMDSGKAFQGSAILVTNANELRVLINMDKDAKNKLIVDGGNNILGNQWNAYRDSPETGYVFIPKQMGVVGIKRGGSTMTDGVVTFLSPPFCLRFNPAGNLIARNGNEDRVIYDGRDYNNRYEPQRTRSTETFNPYAYDPTSNQWNSNNWAKRVDNVDVYKYEVAPFENYENVYGVIIYDKEEFKAASFSLIDVDGDGSDDGKKGVIEEGDAAFTWLKENGTTLFFNRYSGSSIKP